MGGTGFHAVWLVLRLHGWEGCEMEEEEQFDGAGAGFVGRLGTYYSFLSSNMKLIL